MRILIALVYSFFSISIVAQQRHTLELTPGASSPEATLSDVEWIQGYWTGEALGGQVEEIWSEPLGESMMGSFKLVQEGQVKFYEIITISEIDNTLIMRLKHFDAQLKGWEEKEETVDFKLVKLAPDRIFFDGLTFERVSDKEMNVYVRFESGEEHSEGKFNYHRKEP